MDKPTATARRCSVMFMCTACGHTFHSAAAVDDIESGTENSVCPMCQLDVYTTASQYN